MCLVSDNGGAGLLPRAKLIDLLVLSGFDLDITLQQQLFSLCTCRGDGQVGVRARVRAEVGLCTCRRDGQTTLQPRPCTIHGGGVRPGKEGYRCCTLQPRSCLWQ